MKCIQQLVIFFTLGVIFQSSCFAIDLPYDIWNMIHAQLSVRDSVNLALAAKSTTPLAVKADLKKIAKQYQIRDQIAREVLDASSLNQAMSIPRRLTAGFFDEEDLRLRSYFCKFYSHRSYIRTFPLWTVERLYGNEIEKIEGVVWKYIDLVEVTIRFKDQYELRAEINLDVQQKSRIYFASLVEFGKDNPFFTVKDQRAFFRAAGGVLIREDIRRYDSNSNVVNFVELDDFDKVRVSLKRHLQPTKKVKEVLAHFQTN
jgi:hypothetical protein